MGQTKSISDIEKTRKNDSSEDLISISACLSLQHSRPSSYWKTIMSCIVDEEELIPIGLYNGILHNHHENDVNNNWKFGDGNDGWLEKFPVEITLHILQFLELECVGKLQRVSKKFFHYWTRFALLWTYLKKKSPMLYMPPNFNCFSKIKETLLQRFVLEEDVELPLGVQYIMVGSSSCGKSVLVGRAFDNLPFSENYVSTVSMPIIDKCFLYDGRKEFAFQILDTCGNPKFRPFFKSAYSRTNIFVYCFELSCHKSFEEMIEIYEEMTVKKDMSDYNISDRCLIVLGLKSDLEHQVTRDEISIFIKRIEPHRKTLHTSKVQYFELSSKHDSVSDLLFPFLYSLSILETLH